MAKTVISSGCLAFSNRLAALAAFCAQKQLGCPVGVEVVVPRWGDAEYIANQAWPNGASSVHYPMLIGWKKWAEKLYWELVQGGPQANPSHKLGTPMVVHAMSLDKIVAALGEEEFSRRFEGQEVWLENAEEASHPIEGIIKAAKALWRVGARVGACYDVGHAAMFSWNFWEHGEVNWSSFVDEVVKPDFLQLADAGIDVRAAHVHNFDPSAKPQRDHRQLDAGILDIGAVVAELIGLSPDVVLTLESNLVGSKAEMLALRAFGLGRIEILDEAVRNLALLNQAVRQAA